MEYQSENYVAACDFLKLLRNGLDTKEIANILGVSEAFVYNMMHRQRHGEIEQKTNRKPQYRTRIPYAGKEKR